ncbi:MULTISPECIES: Bug family tripartite tricarboxylate transporter substrate binding protein [unclassified Leisingera]|uniref:Bug family tripartite tricarboxylate transporter substrate binding protein n=1 Tax=unclassified Leisingera TaxID=2614906 RepID=UPI00030B6730|nr:MULTISPECIES: tripartite tricarboxylate transporter substrate binding protein [unclassified Leisingera]KIC17397.1 C4-dicarboxylate ABC transporter substrate-binding protein [Leisingera sp. ANG-DT]KIC23619.1 C4-dicarboxylate ABC transporter substrate-binding protein [Leisingera sp. ANG-S3]KIC30573.1 C4-dicarboxylate ABC transporter substrate-binding protein [Leisingera sp. ANG-M6]KIC52190.1 C4-dicarboxylate ABC transporter substrate-binding protein [Leisingera sp. ANG-S]KID09748.1 C4-dicarbo
MKKLIAGAAIALMGLAGAAMAEEYPERPIMMMVSYGAGGATDFQARIVTMTAGNEDALGMPIAIINKPGAGGRVGWNWFATQADADGYTLAAYNVPHFIAQSIKGGVSYSADSFEPIANWGADPAVFVVGADSPFNSMADVVAYATENPGKLTFSGAGLFVGHHIAALQIEKAAGVKMAYIPTKGGGAAAMKAVIAGEVMGGINNLSDAYRAQEAGNVRILGVADLQRSDFLPDVPTMQEQGLEVDNSSVNFRGVMVPKGTPQEVIDKLAATVPAMFANDRVSKKMAAGGSPMHIMTRDEVKEMWAAREQTLKELLAGL